MEGLANERRLHRYHGVEYAATVNLAPLVWSRIDGLMPDLQRQRKTEEKTRVGSLPAPTADVPKFTIGDGQLCDGCSETLQPIHQTCEVTVRGVLPLRFHVDCFSAWVHFNDRRQFHAP